MTWYDYYKKTNDWAVSTSVSKISSLEDMGTPNEITDVIIIIGFEDKKGATKLLNRAVQYGVKFSGENLVEIAELCSKESFNKALYQSADTFTDKDLEDLHCCVDDKLIIELAKRYNISVPIDIFEEYEEELCPNVNTPILWSRFYEAFREWTPEYAKARVMSVTDFGTDDEVLEVVQELFWEDKTEASKLVKKSLDAGVRFKDENIVELTTHCNENTVRLVVFSSIELLTEESLEMLYGDVSDDIIIKVAKERNLRLPEDLIEEDEEEYEKQMLEDLSYEIYSAIDAADYALDCLVYAYDAINNCIPVSTWDMLTTGFFSSFFKQVALLEADFEIRQAQIAVEILNKELHKLSKKDSILLKQGRLTTVIDFWFDNITFDALKHLQLNNASNRIYRTIRRVKKIRRKLIKML